MTYNRFDLALTLFPFTEKQGQKFRPVAILTSAAFHEAQHNAICAMVTTALFTQWPSDVPIAAYASAGLRSPSVIRWKVFTLHLDRLKGTIGRLSDNDSAALADALKFVLP